MATTAAALPLIYSPRGRRVKFREPSPAAMATLRRPSEPSAAAGCVVAGVAIDTDAGKAELMKLVRAPVATVTLVGMEGALIVCRAEGDSKPFDTVAEELKRLLMK